MCLRHKKSIVFIGLVELERGGRMRILFIEWQCFGALHVVKALEDLGHEVERVEFDIKTDRDNKVYLEQAIKVLSYNYFDRVLSYNFMGSIAEACHANGVIYMAWLYDSPLFQVWNTTAYYPECYIFSFDQNLCDSLRKEGIRKVFYMPLAAEAEYLEAIPETEEQIERFTSDVSFVGKLYDKKADLQRDLYKNSPAYLQGFSDAVARAQAQIQGINILEEVLEPEDISRSIDQGLVLNRDDGTIAHKNRLYSDYYLAPKVTSLVRHNMIKRISERFQLKIYTPGSTKRYKKAINQGTVHYYYEMPIVFRHSKINLNITLCSIRTGIPLRCWDIMASGGFLLTNYQEDMLKHFEPGVDFDYFLNEESMIEKIQYYLEHEEERKQIAQNGYEKVKAFHGYKKRLAEMLSIVEGDIHNEGTSM